MRVVSLEEIAQARLVWANKLQEQLNDLQAEYEIAMDFIESLGIKGWTEDLEAFAESHPHNNKED